MLILVLIGGDDMFAHLRKAFQRRPRKYLVFRFSCSIEPLREASVLEETEKTYLIRIPIDLFGIRFNDWEQRIPKSHPNIVEVYTR